MRISSGLLNGICHQEVRLNNEALKDIPSQFSQSLLVQIPMGFEEKITPLVTFVRDIKSQKSSNITVLFLGHVPTLTEKVILLSQVEVDHGLPFKGVPHCRISTVRGSPKKSFRFNTPVITLSRDGSVILVFIDLSILTKGTK